MNDREQESVTEFEGTFEQAPPGAKALRSTPLPSDFRWGEPEFVSFDGAFVPAEPGTPSLRSRFKIPPAIIPAQGPTRPVE
jgi:hypothetical protein